MKKRHPRRVTCFFETGYGPSGLPHIGTFGEVARTTMVKRAFEEISDIPTKLVCFSDDLDGMRKVPGQCAQSRSCWSSICTVPLTDVPDPFGTHTRALGTTTMQCCAGFWIRIGFDYDFISARDFYSDRSVLTRFCCDVRRRYDDLMKIMLKSLARGASAETYSIFLAFAPRNRARDVCSDEKCGRSRRHGDL